MAASCGRATAPPQGTGLLADINDRNVAGSYPTGITAVGSDVFFFANDGVSANELWKSDGTAAGSSLVHDFSSDPELGQDPTSGFFAAQAGGRLVFTLRLANGFRRVSGGATARMAGLCA